MKYIITESQDERQKNEKKADLVYKMLNKIFPENYESVDSNEDIELYDNETNENLLFYYRFDGKEFYVGVYFISTLYESTKVDFFDYEMVKYENREMFNNIMKIFAKKYYGWNVDFVYFHWY